MAVILKNTTGSEIVIGGQGIPASGQYTMQESDKPHFASSDLLVTKIGSGEIVINDGVSDLGISEGTDLVKGYFPKEVDLLGKSAIQKAVPVAIYKPEETSFSRCTHDFSNKCTWYTNSVRVTGETLLGTALVWTTANQFVIDVDTGVVNRQDTLQSYRLIVYDNGTEVSNSDYIVDYRTGTITFTSTPTGPVTADYSYSPDTVGSSEWKVSPTAGNMLIIEHSEVQFTSDVLMTTPMKFEVWIDNPYVAVTGHPLFGIPRIPAESIQYNSIRDIINESNLGYQVPTMASIGQPVVVFPFNYVTVKPLHSALNTELIISSVGDTEMIGTFGTATFYLVSRPDSLLGG